MMGRLIFSGSLIHIEETQIMYQRSRVIKMDDKISGSMDLMMEAVKPFTTVAVSSLLISG